MSHVEKQPERRVVLTVPTPSGTLYGTLHKGAGEALERTGATVLLLSAGLRSRSGPHELYVRLASALCAEGHDVLRLDCGGVGDSQGQLPERPLLEIDHAVDRGLFVDDVRAAMDTVIQECGARRIVLSGLCAGATTALLTAGVDERVDALLLMGIATLMTPEPAEAGLTEGAADVYLDGYRRKILRVESWRRLLSLQSNYRALGTALYLWARRRALPRGRRVHPRLNTKALEALQRCAARGVRMLFVFGDGDIELGNFNVEFVGKALGRELQRRVNEALVVIPKADHTFTGQASLERLVCAVRDWLAAQVAEVGEAATGTEAAARSCATPG
jgi:pimeloyl-ACP methyl ester carboxylesterase